MRNCFLKKRSNVPGTIQQQSIKDIHWAVRQSFTAKIAAETLNIGDVSTLTSHLGKFILDGEILNFSSFKALSVQRAKRLWGTLYQQPMMAPVIQMNHYSGHHIYFIVCHSKTIREAASKLGTRDHSLERYLNTFSYKGKPCTFLDLKFCTERQARAIFSDKFNGLFSEQRYNLTPHKAMSYSFSLTHQEHDFDTLIEVLPVSIFGDSMREFAENLPNKRRRLA